MWIKKIWENRLKMNHSAIKWGLWQAWEIDKKTLIFWAMLSFAGSMFPVVFISMTQRIIDAIQNGIRQGQNVHNMVNIFIILIIVMILQDLYSMLPKIAQCTMETRYGIGMQKK